jgi:SAM-dependent methyltransferase
MSLGQQVSIERPTIQATVEQGFSAAPLLYGATIFLSAFLLFLVQPIIGKIILPWFGGSAGVWAACLLFFQACLLAGYAYAHGLRRLLPLRMQVRVHVLLLAGSLAVLPILPSAEWRHPGSFDPALRILALLASTIGLPYLLICSTSPLLQAWYAAIRPGSSPYRFYALSNLGSMLGLICFPWLVEPHLTSRVQAWDWSGAYIGFALLCALAGWYGNQKQDLQHRGKEGAEGREEVESGDSQSKLSGVRKPNFAMQLLWIAFAACGAALMMAVTNHLSQNVAPIPLLWILPLGLYLFTFVLCFDTDKIYQRWIWIPAMLLGLSAMTWAMYYHGGTTNLRFSIPAMLFGMFSCCMVCHGELARHKPAPRYLTYFYLLTSAGGVLGGFFVAIIAPHIFRTYMELPLAMIFCVVLAWAMVWRRIEEHQWILRVLTRSAVGAFIVVLAAFIFINKDRADRKFYLQVRNFYGMLQLRDMETGDEDGRVRTLQHGIIEHGAQLLDPAMRHEPTLYYVKSSGVGMALQYEELRGRVRVGAIGLGAGVLASYCRIGDYFEFYEINPAVVKIANSEFTFLRDCHGQAEVRLGDARLTLEGQPAQEFDVLVVDAFSGDAIPIHLITREAVIEYFRHLKPGGILAIHVSNKYLDLVPVVARIVEDLHKGAIAVYDSPGIGSYPSESDWVLVATKPEIFDDKIFDVDTVQSVEVDSKVAMWTDDFSNILQILDLGRAKNEKDDEVDDDDE